MTKSDLLARLLNTSGLARIVPHLPPEILHRVIQTCGLEDCGEFVALATPAQLARVLDVDVWRVERRGLDETLDADRFGVWLEVLMELGGAVAAEKLRGMDIELVVAGLAQHALVFDAAAVSSYTTLDGAVVPARISHATLTCEVGGYVADAKRTGSWDAIVELLRYLALEDAEYFQRLMRACVRLSSGAREADGFHNLLDDSAQDMFDLATDREARRERQGYLSPTQARAFLQMSRQLQLGDSQPPSANPVARAYFRAVEWAAPADAGSFASARVLSAPGSDSAPGDAADVIAGVAGIIDVLRDAGVLTQPPRGLLEASHDQPSRLALIREYLESSAAGPEGLAFLANAMMAGCVVQARPFTEKEASDAAAAICNLGLENWPRAWPERDLLTAFQVGWTVVYRDVCLYAAEQLIDVLADLRCTDRDVLLPLKELRLALTKHCRERAPWRARNALEVIVMLDAPAWAALAGLIDECPVIHAALIALRGSGAKTVSATAFEFISENAQIAFVREFMRSLPAVLVS